MTVLSVLQFARWAYHNHWFDSIFGMAWKPPHQHCTGAECYEVFSCFGLKDATQHIREPLVWITGIFFFPLGAYAAHHGFRQQLQLLGGYLIVSALVHAGLLAFDMIFVYSCNMYTTNIVKQTLINGILPPSPFMLATQDMLQNMNLYPVKEVDKLTNSFPSLAWYFAFAGAGLLILAYASYEVHLLGDLFERGPLGLGIHYGLGQWDELINHDAIRRHKAHEMRSQFIDDAKMPLEMPVDIETPLGYAVHQEWESYGTIPPPLPKRPAFDEMFGKEMGGNAEVHQAYMASVTEEDYADLQEECQHPEPEEATMWK